MVLEPGAVCARYSTFWNESLWEEANDTGVGSTGSRTSGLGLDLSSSVVRVDPGAITRGHHLCPHLSAGDDRILGGLDELWHIKHLSKCFPFSKYSINESCQYHDLWKATKITTKNRKPAPQSCPFTPFAQSFKFRCKRAVVQPVQHNFYIHWRN